MSNNEYEQQQFWKYKNKPKYKLGFEVTKSTFYGMCFYDKNNIPIYKLFDKPIIYNTNGEI